jgi:hypothetical protein
MFNKLAIFTGLLVAIVAAAGVRDHFTTKQGTAGSSDTLQLWVKVMPEDGWKFNAEYPTKVKIKWSLHNLVAHPLSELLHLVGFARASNWIHDATIPEHKPDTGQLRRMSDTKTLLTNLSDHLLDEISTEFRKTERNRDTFRVRLILASERRTRQSNNTSTENKAGREE